MPFGRAVIIDEDDADGFVFTSGKRLVLNEGVTLSNPSISIVDIHTALDATQGIDDRFFTIRGTIEAFLIAGQAFGMDIVGDEASVNVAATGAVSSARTAIRIAGDAPTIVIADGAMVAGDVIGLDLDLAENAQVTIAGRLQSDEVALAFSGQLATVTIEAGGVIRGDLVAEGETRQIVSNGGKIVGDVLLGDGDDFFNGIGGVLNGTVFGGDGDEQYFVDDADITIVEAEDEGEDFVVSVVTFTLGENIEILSLQGGKAIDGFGNDIANGIGGNDRANRIEGRGGDDDLTGAGGNDRLFGGDGDDDLKGGAGADRLVGDDGSDTARYAGSERGVRVDLASGEARRGDAQGDTLSGIENLDGSFEDDVLKGDAGNNILSGLAGTDVLTGRGGNDVFAMLDVGGTWKVTDFVHGEDRIDVSFLGFGDISDLDALVSVKNGNTVITVDRDGDDAVMVLKGIDSSVLDNGDFIF
jgi:Ca2+-binding RTX toxin-like protein